MINEIKNIISNIGLADIVKTLFYILSAVLIGFGIYMFGLYVTMPPTNKSKQIVSRVNNLDKGEKQTLINKVLGGFSQKVILGFVELSATTKYKLQTALDYFHYNVSPEQHFSDALAAGILVMFLCALLMFVNPYFGVLALVLGVFIFSNELNAPVKKLNSVKKNIEYDSALFCKFIADALKEDNRNVIEILTSCKESVSNDFKLELEHTLTDLKTGNQEEALVAMSKRVGSSTMTQIVVGLLGVLRGDDQTIYFDMLYEKLYKEELARIKKSNSTKAGTISKLAMVLILPVIAMILIPIILVLAEELKKNGVI